MNRKLVLALTLTLLIGTLHVAFNVQKAKASGTVYIRADGSVDPPDAPISSLDNITYTFADNINDSIVVERDNIGVDGAGYTVTGSGSGNGTTLTGRSNVTVRNMTIRNFYNGIYLDSSSNNTLSGNNVTNNALGIWLYYSSNNTLSGNNVTANNGSGIYLDYFCNNNVLSGSNITANKYIGIGLSESSSDNTLSGNNIAANNESGIVLSGSSHNTVSGNSITNNLDGIYLGWSSSSNTVFGNNLTANNKDGVLLWSSSNNSIAENNIAANNGSGLYLREESNNNSISGNNITNNWSGIYLYSSGNSISGNNITNNEYGIYLECDSGDKFNHNNFISNTNQVYSYYSANVWDDGYPSGGNYWSNYTGVDANGDGIGDTPYVIDENNKDRYPLMNQWTASWNQSQQVPPTTEVQVGVKAGDWIKVDYTITGAPSGTPLPQWLKVEFLSVEGTNATARVTMHMSDGTEQNATLPVDVVAGGQAFGLSGFVIPANLTVGNVVYMSGYGNVTIAGETTGSYAGAGRTVVYASFSQYGTQLTYYWDKQTGVIVEASTTSGTMTGTGKATETNMWQSARGFPIDQTLIYIAIAVVIVAAAVFLVLRRRRASTEGTTPKRDSHE